MGTDAVGSLAASGTSAKSSGLTAPASTGTYYYGACVDDVTGESDTSNNCSSAVTVAVGAPPPDLPSLTGSITTCKATQSTPFGLFSVTIGGTVTASRRVRAVFIRGYVGSDFIGVFFINSMTAGESVNFRLGGFLSSPAGSCRFDMEWETLRYGLWTGSRTVNTK